MKDFSEIMRQAQAMQSRLAEAQAEIEAIEITGRAGAGLVTVTLKGKGSLEALHIDPSLLAADQAEIVEDLIKAAHADARRRLDEAMAEKMSKVAGGLGALPGFKMPF